MDVPVRRWEFVLSLVTVGEAEVELVHRLAMSSAGKQPRSDCLVILPTFNEVATLPRIVQGVSSRGCDVLVVDDNSPDGTGTIADAIAESMSGVQVLHRTRKLGIGSAYRAGFYIGLERGYRFIVEMDADGSHDSGDLGRLIAAARDTDGLAIGSRYIDGGETEGWSAQRQALSWAANALCRSSFRRTLRDWTSGFRCYSTRVFEKIGLERLSSDGFSIQIELAWRCLQNDVPVVEVPITFTERLAGASKASTVEILEALACIVRLRVLGRAIGKRRTAIASRSAR